MNQGTVIVTKVQKSKPVIKDFPRVYQGLIAVYQHNVYLYSTYTGINRMDATDAKRDAEFLKSETIILNKVQ